MSASLIGRLGSSAFRLSAAAMAMSLAGSCFSTDSARQAGPSWDSKTRWNDLLGGLAVGRSKRTYELTSSIVPRGTPFHRVVELGFLLFHLISYRVHTAAASLVQRNSVPSTQRRCMTTAKRRASATIALFMPRRLAICIAQALSHDLDFDQIAPLRAGLELCCRGLTEVSPYASSVAWLLFLYDYDAHRRRGGADRLLQHLNVKTRESPSPSACNRSDSYGGDTTSIIARRERSIASKIRGERSVASKRCLSGRCHGKSGH